MFRHPFLGANDRHTVHLGARVELEKLGPEPVHHFLFDFDGAGRGGVNDNPRAADIVAFTHFGRQLQHPHEHGRNPLTVRDRAGQGSRPAYARSPREPPPHRTVP